MNLLTPSLVPSDQEGRSFSSGHAATVFWLVVVANVVTGRFGLWTALALAYALAVSATRTVPGGHFLSDVVMSRLFVVMGWCLLSALFFSGGA